MTTEKLKENLIESIRNTDDSAILEDIQRMLDFETGNDTYILSAEQKKSVEAGKRDFENGDYMSNEEVNDYFDKWLKG